MADLYPIKSSLGERKRPVLLNLNRQYLLIHGYLFWEPNFQQGRNNYVIMTHF